MLRKELARYPIINEKVTADSIDYGSGKGWKMVGLADCLAVGAGYGPGRNGDNQGIISQYLFNLVKVVQDFGVRDSPGDLFGGLGFLVICFKS